MSNQDINRGQEKGVMVTINANGDCEHKAFGTLNEAEVLGMGQYLMTLTQVGGLRGLINGQMELWKVLKELTSAVEGSLNQKGASCSTESSLDSSPSEDSTSSTESPGNGSNG